MTRTASWLLSVGMLLFVALLASRGLPAIFSSLKLAGWGLVLIALFHLLLLVLDAYAIRVLFVEIASSGRFWDSLLSRWIGESANSLMPGGQLGGPVLMARHLLSRGMPMRDAAAAITVSTTLQSIAQIAFALVGVAMLGAHSARTSSLIASGVLALQIGGFYLLQRRGLFSRLMRTLSRVSGKRDWSSLLIHAAAIDAAVVDTYGRSGAVAGSFLLSLIGWIVGTGEVYFILQLLQSPVSWGDAFILESLGQAIRGAAFAIPGALGVQEGGYLLLAPLTGLTSEVALALSLSKRAREVILGLPGLLYLHWSPGSGAVRK